MRTFLVCIHCSKEHLCLSKNISTCSVCKQWLLDMQYNTSFCINDCGYMLSETKSIFWPNRVWVYINNTHILSGNSLIKIGKVPINLKQSYLDNAQILQKKYALSLELLKTVPPIYYMESYDERRKK